MKSFKEKSIIAKIITVLVVLACLVVVGFGAYWAYNYVVVREMGRYGKVVNDADNPVPKPDIDVKLLEVNEYSRPGTKVDIIKGIVIHYTANPGSSALNNRNYFNNLKDTHDTYASSNFIVGIEGEIIQCVPIWEVAYASNDRNNDTISIENCHINEDGSFEKATYDSLVHLTAWLTVKFGLTTDDIIRHYDVTGKLCPKYFVEHEDKWKVFKEDVQLYIDECYEK